MPAVIDAPLQKSVQQAYRRWADVFFNRSPDTTATIKE
jgi:hypothetical protein